VRDFFDLMENGHLSIASFVTFPVGAVVESEEGSGEDGLEALAALYVRTGRPREAASCLQRLAAIENDPTRRALIFRQLAAIWRSLGAVGKGEECLEWALALDRGCEPAYQELAALYLSERRWRAAIDVYFRHARIALRPTRARIHAELARLYEDELHDLQRAMDCYQLLEQDLDDPSPALRALARLAEQREQFDEATRALTLLAEHSSRGEQVELLVHAGTLTLARLQDARGAGALFRRALDVQPGDVAARLGAAAALRQCDDVEAALVLLYQGLTQACDADQARLLAAMVELEGELRDPSAAAELRSQACAAAPARKLGIREWLARLFALDRGRGGVRAPITARAGRPSASRRSRSW
jgi:tetratricopeptide (TPR) repeat protein